jgi:hypothetical protein
MYLQKSTGQALAALEMEGLPAHETLGCGG